MSKIILRLDSEVEIVIDPDDTTILIQDNRTADDEDQALLAFCEWDEVDAFVRNEIQKKKK